VKTGDSNFERRVDMGETGVFARDRLWELTREDARRDNIGEEGDRLIEGGGAEGPGEVMNPCGGAEGAEESFLVNEWRASSWGSGDRCIMSLSEGGESESMTTGLKRDSRPESPCGIDELKTPRRGGGGPCGRELRYWYRAGSTQECIAI
jgi:hypothetical protein